MSAITPASSYKTIVIRPGETQVVKKNINIIKTINNGNVSVSSSCTDLTNKLNQTAENLVSYVLLIEVVDELINRNGEDFLTGVGLGNDFYRFASPISLNAFKVTFPDNNSGEEQLYKAIVNTIPSGSVFFSSPTYGQENWGGPSGDSSRDNFYRSSIFFKSFPSIVEDLSLYVLYENVQSFTANFVKYNMRIYPTRANA